jgi:hypothetical protein
MYILKRFFVGCIIVFSNLCFASVANYDPSAKFVGSYTMPSPANLKSFATWQLQYVNWIKENNNIRASYVLPDDLTQNTSHEYAMSGKVEGSNAFIALSGDQADASCLEVDGSSLICLVKFHQKQMKFQIEQAFFKRKYKSTAAAEKRFTVAKLFAADPIGIIRIDKK